MNNLEPLPIFDTHAHLDLEPLSDDIEGMLRRLEEGDFPNGCVPAELKGKKVSMVGVLLPGITVESSRHCIALAEKSPLFHAAAAIHPNSGFNMSDQSWKEIEALAHRPDVRAIGETGLDQHWKITPVELQIEYFQRHLDLAQSVNKPILIHCRDAWDEMLPILERNEGVRGVIHAFSGPARQAEEALRLGYMISFAGSLTYRTAKFAPLWDAAKIVPLDRLLLETDSPFMAPHPFREKIPYNEPIFAVSVAIRLAELRNEPLETICEATAKNARQIFTWRLTT